MAHKKKIIFSLIFLFVLILSFPLDFYNWQKFPDELKGTIDRTGIYPNETSANFTLYLMLGIFKFALSFLSLLFTVFLVYRSFKITKNHLFWIIWLLITMLLYLAGHLNIEYAFNIVGGSLA